MCSRGLCGSAGAYSTMEDPVTNLSMPKSRGLALVACASILVLAAGGGGAVAGSLITSKDIQDKSIKKVDLAKNSVVSTKVADGSLKLKDLNKKANDKINKGGPGRWTGRPGWCEGSPGRARPQGRKDRKDRRATPAARPTSAPNWSIVDRNVIGNGDAYLRSGPSLGPAAALTRPPKGIGSLGIRTGSDNDKAAFGNQVDFGGTLLSHDQLA